MEGIRREYSTSGDVKLTHTTLISHIFPNILLTNQHLTNHSFLEDLENKNYCWGFKHPNENSNILERQDTASRSRANAQK